MKSSENKGMSTNDTALAIISTIIGGGIVGVPFSMMHTGIPVGILLHTFVALTCAYSCSLYIKAKDLTPVPVESLYEISNVLIGRWSIYLISVIVLGVSSGLMMIYFIVFGDVFASVSSQLFFNSEENFMTTRAFYVLALGLCLTPLVIKKHLKELTIVSVTLFVTIALFMLLFLI